MSVVVYAKKILPLDVADTLKAEGVQPQDVTVEEDADEVRITIKNIILTRGALAKLDLLCKGWRRKE